MIGIGNRDRGDDAVGPVVADAIAELEFPTGHPGVVTSIAEGDLSDLALRWNADQAVIIVDATVSGAEPGTIVEIDGLVDRLPSDSTPVSSHGFALGDAVELARLLGRLPRSLTIIGVEARSFDDVAPISESVRAAIPAVIDRITATLDSTTSR